MRSSVSILNKVWITTLPLGLFVQQNSQQKYATPKTRRVYFPLYINALSCYSFFKSKGRLKARYIHRFVYCNKNQFPQEVDRVGEQGSPPPLTTGFSIYGSAKTGYSIKYFGSEGNSKFKTREFKIYVLGLVLYCMSRMRGISIIQLLFWLETKF